MSFERKTWLGLMAASLMMLSCNAGTGGRPLMGGNIGGGDRHETTAVVADGVAEPAEGLELPALRTSSGEQILRRTAYTASYNKENRLPDWVAWHLTADHTTGAYGRKGIKFREDEDVPEPRATDADYYNSGYDRGHMCPSADCKWSEEAQLESFLFTNACPQVHGLNAGDWNEIEQQCRRWAKEFGSLYIVSGPVFYRGSHKKIGRNKVVVPEAFFKVVLCMEGEPKAIGFIYKNVSGNRPKSSYVNTVDEVERITGLDFFPALPDDVEERVESRTELSDWGLK
ncbi:MAG: DNA/RNA non-specific endonuclease [Prevotella sp.]|nr:DNA/RNA non-specific endonuclease [Prevotella sp.]